MDMVKFEFEMGGAVKAAMVCTIFGVLRFSPLHGQARGHRLVFVDNNYKEVAKEKGATYEVEIFDFSDTVYFETRSRSPKGLIEKGQYPINLGFDLRNCEIQRFWPNGNVRSKGEIKNSWNEGLWTFYDENGEKYSEVEFLSGLITGAAKRLYNNGTIRTYTYQKNIKQGESSFYDTSGKLLQICNYTNDSLDGLLVSYYQTGKIQRKTLYAHGFVQKDSWYYEEGNLFNAEQYDNKGILHGRCMMYTHSGKIARLDDYAHGEVIQNDCIHPLADADWKGDDCPPRLIKAKYPPGIEKYMEFVGLNQEYPETAIQWRQQGVVIYEFTIGPYGLMENITEENIVPVGFGLEKESMRLLKKMQRYEPERVNGKIVPVRIQMPYVFILQE